MRATGPGGGTAAIAALLAGLVAAACFVPPGQQAVELSTPAGVPILRFEPGIATRADGPFPRADARKDCGALHQSFLSELTTNPLAPHVLRHYGPIEPGAFGLPRLMAASGKVDWANVGSDDLPFDHPYGGDMTGDVSLDAPYVPLGQHAGVTGTPTPGIVHVEVESGQVPHVSSTPALVSGSAWPDVSAGPDNKDVDAAFVPQGGDRIAATGHWIIDCGHPDFHTELHDLGFVAFGHASGASTVIHTFYVPYYPTELYNQDTSLASAVTNTSRYTASGTQALPNYIISQIIQLALSATAPAASFPSLEGANTASPPPFVVCAPQGTSGTSLQVSYDLSVRPGVHVAVSTAGATQGCATFDVQLGRSFTPLDTPGQQTCILPWAWLDSEAAGQLGVGSLNLQQLIYNEVVSIDPAAGPNLLAHLNQDPTADCDQPLAEGGISVAGTPGQVVSVSSAQAYPIIGWVKVAWA